MEFFTIGVYNSSEEEFFKKLTANRIDAFCDIRQRRGVRGAKYSFVNSNKLQEKLETLGIKYGHILDLAPTTEIRTIQKDSDLKNGELKTERKELSIIFKTEYENRVLSKFNFDSFLEHLGAINASKIVLFCVEEHANACHRSIVAKKLGEEFHYTITHL